MTRSAISDLEKKEGGSYLFKGRPSLSKIVTILSTKPPPSCYESVQKRGVLEAGVGRGSKAEGGTLIHGGVKTPRPLLIEHIC